MPTSAVNAFFEHPILNSPYECPSRHWELAADGQPTQKIIHSRRIADFITPIPTPKKQKNKAKQGNLLADVTAQSITTEKQEYHKALINEIRHHVADWRALPQSQWKVTPETARLLNHWRNHKFSGIRPFFCQVEAVETAIWLTEVAPSQPKYKKYLEHLEDANEDANPGLSRLALKLGDYCITEAGFGSDLGAEKFLDIKCRYAGIAPSACVLVATLRALKSHGGVAKADLSTPNLEAVKKGAANLVRHIDNMKNGFGLPVVVAINAFPTDTAEEQAYVEQVCAEQGVPCVLSEVFAKGGEGGKALAEKVLDIMEDRPIQYTYPLEMPLKDKINAIATKIYRADGVNYSAAASKTLAELTELGYGDLPVCIAKTQYSFSDNAKLTGAPTGFTMEVREVRLAAGAGFVVVICGSIMTMPGLPKKPAAVGIDVDADGKITGLF